MKMTTDGSWFLVLSFTLGLHDCLNTGDLTANDQCIDLIGSFVGVHRFHISEMTGHMVLQEDAITSKDLTPKRDNLTRPSTTRLFRKRSMPIGHLALITELGKPPDHQLH